MPAPGLFLVVHPPGDDVRSLLQLAVNGVRRACPDASGWMATALPDDSITPSEVWPTSVPVSAFHPDPLSSWWLPGLRIVAHQGAVTNHDTADRWEVMSANGGGRPIPDRWWPRSRVTLVGLVDTRDNLPELWADHLPGGTPLWWPPEAVHTG